MTLVLDRPDLRDKPAIHALIAGVSRYTYLPGGGGAPEAAQDFGLAQLDSTARTANLICEWLKKEDQEKRLPLEVGSIRLLLSPSDGEADLPATTECTWDKFSEEAAEWREAASRNDRSMTFFYFAGHGLQFPPQRQILLMSDFGQKVGGTFHRTVEMDDIFLGMAPHDAALKQIARTQFYFIDACRTPPGDLPELEATSVPKIWGLHRIGVDDRARPVFYGAPPGLAANALPGKQTLFSEALLDCLGGLAAVGPEGADDRWQVHSLSLTPALEVAIARVNKKYEAKGAKQSFHPLPSNKATLVYLKEPPLVPVQVQIDPDLALPLFRLDILDDEMNPVAQLDPIAPHPFVRHLPAGTYTFRATLRQPPNPQFRERVKSMVIVPIPPASPWIAKVTP